MFLIYNSNYKMDVELQHSQETPDMKNGLLISILGHINVNVEAKKLWTKNERRVWLVTLFVGSAMLYATRTVMPLCIVSMAQDKDWDKTESGIVLSAFFWGYTTTQVLGGFLSDKIGGVTVLATGAMGWSVITLITPWITDILSDHYLILYSVASSRAIVGAFQGVYFPSLINIISQKVANSERSFSFSVTDSGTTIGTVFCGTVGSLILEKYNWSLPFFLLGGLSLGWTIFLRSFLIPHQQHKKDNVLIAQELSGTLPRNDNNVTVPWIELFKHTSFWAIIVGHVCQNNALYILLSWLPTYFHDNFPDAKGWVFNVIPWTVSVPSAIFAGYFADHLIAQGYSITFVRKLINTFTMGGCAIFLLCIPYTKSFEGALFFMTMAIACTGFHSAGILVNPQDIAPKYTGSVFGLMNTAGSIPGFVGVYIAGYILEVTGNWAAVFNQTAVVLFIGWFVFTMLGTGKQIVS